MEPQASELNTRDRRIVDRVDLYLRRGLDLKAWWDDSGRGDFDDRFELAFTFNRPDVAYGFFDEAPVEGRPLPVLGTLQTQFYDQPKSPARSGSEAAGFLNRQVQQFVLRYFMRVSDFRDPQAYTRADANPPPLLRPLSWCPSEDPQLQGFGYSQLYYKLRDGGRVGKFPADRRSEIIDLRRIGPEFEWIVVKVRIFDFNFTFQPFGPNGPFMTLPLREDSLLILTPDFLTNDAKAREGRLGRYGLGYAFIKNPGPSLLGWGPGEFDAAFQTIDFDVLSDGRVRVSMLFVANRPTSIVNFPMNPFEIAGRMTDTVSQGATSAMTEPFLNLARRVPFSTASVDPVLGSIALVNLMTGGLAARELCISRRQFEKDLILKHFSQHYNTIVGSLQTWRQIRDWLDTEHLPRWVVTGESA